MTNIEIDFERLTVDSSDEESEQEDEKEIPHPLEQVQGKERERSFFW